MGFADNMASLEAIVSRKSDLELENRFLENHKLYLTSLTNGFFNMQSKLEPDSPAAKLLEARIKQLEQADKILDMHIRRVTAQQEALSKELESTQKLVDKNIETSFGLMGK